MTVGTLSRLGASIAPSKFRDTCRTFKSVLVCRTRRYDVPSEPHLDAASSTYFRERLANTRNYLEYGSGGSTVLASRVVQLVVSVDSDAHFLAAVRNKLAADEVIRGLRESRGAITRLMHVRIGLTVDWGMPALTRPTPRRVRLWQAYPTAPWCFFRSIGQQPDLVLIDGRFRVACALESLLNLSPLSEAQVLLDDYLTRPHYHVVERFADPEMVGRMAVLRPKRFWDRSEARRVLDEYRTDYR